VYLYRWRCGWLLGHRFLLLIHTGRRTGKRRETVLEVMRYRPEGPEAVVLSAFGPRAGWLLNLQGKPDVEVVVGTHRFAARYRMLHEAEAIEVLDFYERQHRRFSLLIRAVLSRLVGWRYDGTDYARRRLVSELPMVAFRPR
jgi:deazaflavin-dependent oxidoreductase (nitroreductase family)